MGQRISVSQDFVWTYTQQPHANRRAAIVKKYPQIKRLFGVDYSLKYVVLCSVIGQIIAAYLLRDADWLLIFLQAYFYGGLVNHALTLAIHDISHNTAFGNDAPLKNRFFGMVANLPIAIPISISFKKYHVEHHRYLGEDALDTDVPTEFEAKFFTSPARKLLWLILQPLFYGLRPLLIYKKYPTDLEIVNFVLQLSFDFAIWQWFGAKSLIYLLSGTLMALGGHPSAAHFVAEHYLFDEDSKQETYSYYGPFNWVLYNVGYHNEHHDFPYIPGRYLPQVRNIAPEFYDTLHHHDSCLSVLHDFIFSSSMGPFRRLKRPPSVPQERYGDNPLRKYFSLPNIARKVKSVLQYFYFSNQLLMLFSKSKRLLLWKPPSNSIDSKKSTKVS
ncbi:fatty acid desaturase domain-containing protein [Ditylenchus destructor]|nr:fatty acid desaturase domain-containing protein [Ditylenchus destructor]